eukprot:Colp12_sorted_trinity150504_noHs@34926
MDAKRNWKQNILKQLVQRDQSQWHCFNDLIVHGNKQTEVIRTLKLQAWMKDRELVLLKQENTDLQAQIFKLREQSDSGPGSYALQQKVAQVEEKLLRCQEELTESYKTKNANTQKLLDMSDQLKQQETILRKKEDELKTALEAFTLLSRQHED